MRSCLQLAMCFLLVGVCAVAQAGSIDRRIQVGAHARTYVLYVPASVSAHAPAPLVIAFHGGTGQGRSMAALAQFAQEADRDGFLVAYPDGLRGHWRDGRTMPRGLVAENVDDVAFVVALIADVGKFHAVDSRRIYAAGMSNGAIFAHYLALKIPERIAAIAAVGGGVATDIAGDFMPAAPVSVMIIHGRDDPLVPYAGGSVGGTHGSVVSTDAAVRLWLRADGISAGPRISSETAKAAGDCAEQWRSWSGGRDGSAVTLISLDGGGHTWPGGKQYLPKLLVGAVCPELNATHAIWEFFKQHPKP